MQGSAHDHARGLDDESPLLDDGVDVNSFSSASEAAAADKRPRLKFGQGLKFGMGLVRCASCAAGGSRMCARKASPIYCVSAPTRPAGLAPHHQGALTGAITRRRARGVAAE